MRSAAGLVIGAAAALLVTGGCASFGDGEGFSEVEKLTRERAGQTARWRGDQKATDDEVDAAARRLLADELDVNAAVQVALLKSPDLQVLYEDVAIAQANLLQTWLPPNPEIEAGVRFGSVGGGLDVDASIVGDVVGVILMPWRIKLAGREREIVELRVADAVLARIAVVKQAYVEHVAATELLGLERVQASAAEVAAALAERQRAVGAENDLFFATRTAAAIEARLNVARAEAALVQSREALNRAMGLFGDDLTWRTPAVLPDIPLADVSFDDLEASAVADRLDLAAGQGSLDIADQRLALAAPWLVPFIDLDAGASLESDDGDFSIGPTMRLAVPIFDWGQARRARLEAEQRAAQSRVAALAVDVRSRVRGASAEVRTARATVDYLRRSLLPARAQIVALSLLHYQRMTIGVFDLLRAREEQLEAQREEVLARRGYWDARARLERLIGRQLPYVEAPPPPPATTPTTTTTPAMPPMTMPMDMPEPEPATPPPPSGAPPASPEHSLHENHQSP